MMFAHVTPILVLGLAFPSTVDARLNLLRIAHWQNHQFHKQENQISQEELHAAGRSLSSIATKLQMGLNNRLDLRHSRDFDDDSYYNMEMEESGYMNNKDDAQRELEHHDVHR